MIYVEEAKKLIIESTVRLNPVIQDVTKSLNHILAEDVISPISYPPFNQSAMDGYAILYSDYIQKNAFTIIGEAPAGKPFKEAVSPGSAVRIFTGSKIPDGYDTVVMQEKVVIENNQLIIKDAALACGANVREEGNQIKKEDIAMEKGMALNVGVIGFLTGIGLTSVLVYPKPKVSIIVTGSELQKPGQPIESGQVYESNSFSLVAALESIQIPVTNVIAIGDNENQTTDALLSAAETSDIILVSGGISVGKYDFVGKCLQELGAENIFYKVYQKPGKPIYFGKLKNSVVFGLPGNPAAALSCFYEYVYTAIKMRMGSPDVFLKKVDLAIGTVFHKKEGLALFLKGKTSGKQVNILLGQESNNIRSFVHADCIIYLPAEKGAVAEGELVEVHLLP